MDDKPVEQAIERQLIQMTRRLGREEADHVILGEGNTSARLDKDNFLVKASGERMVNIRQDGFVAVDMARALSLVGARLDGDALKEALEALKIDPSQPGTPSIEVLMHAVSLEYGRASFIGHTHSTAITGLLCSDRAVSFSHARLFPDHIVLCGVDSAFVPYVDPGLPLAYEVHKAIEVFINSHGIPPKTIMLQNHGIIVLGNSPIEVEQILAMSVKAARIYAGACESGEPVSLSKEEMDRIASRSDEHYRLAKLMAGDQ